MERRQFIMVGGGVVAAAAVGAAGSRVGSGMGTDGQLVAMASSRGLSGDEARGALQTAVPPGKYDPYYMFASAGHLGQVQVIGVPSMRLLKVIPVFTRDAYSGYEPFSEIYRGPELLQELRNPDALGGRCGQCEFRTVCGGSRSHAYATTGDPLAEDPSCAYQPVPGREVKLVGEMN